MNAPPTNRPFAHRYRRRGWTTWELLLLVSSIVLIVAPLVAVGVALLLPQTTSAQTVDLRVSKIATSLIGADLTSIGPGQEFYYEIVVQTGSTDALDVTLSDTFPAGVEPVAIRDQNGGECSIAGNQVDCAMTATSLRPATVLIQSRISASATVGTQITNVAVATSGSTAARSSVAVLVGSSGGPAPTTAPEAPSATTPPAAATSAPSATTQAEGPTAIPATATRTTVATLTPVPASPTTGTPLPTSTPQPPTATPMETAIVLQSPTPATSMATPARTATSAPPTATSEATSVQATQESHEIPPTATMEPTSTDRPTEQPTPITAQGAMASPTIAATEAAASPTEASAAPTESAPTPPPPPTESIPEQQAAPPPPNTPVPAAPAPSATQRPAPAPTQRPAAPAPTERPAAGGAQQPAPPAAPEELGSSLPSTSGGLPIWLPILIGMMLLVHTLRAHRARTRI